MFKNLFLKTNKASNCKITMQAPKDREDSKWLKLDPQTNQVFSCINSILPWF